MRKIEDNAKNIREMLSDDQLEEAIRHLFFTLEEFELPRKFVNELFLLKNQFTRHKKEHILQLRDNREFQIERNNLLKQLLDYIDAVVDWVNEHPLQETTIDDHAMDVEDLALHKPFLVATGIEKNYGDFKLGPVDITLSPGKIYAVFGPNGSGKSTLLNIMAGVLKQSNGALEYFGQTVSDWYAVKMQIGYIPQQFHDKDIDLTDLLKYKCITHGIPAKELDYHVQDVITKLNLGSVIHKPWSALSGGFKMRVELACTLVWRPSILILDEPLANLDIVTQQHFISDLLNYARSKTKPITILLTSQHIEILETKVDNILFLKEGHVEFSGTPQELADQTLAHQIELEIHGNGKVEDPALFLERQFREITVRRQGDRYVVKTPKEIRVQSVIQQLLGAGFNVTYYKDVSASVRKMFSYEQN